MNDFIKEAVSLSLFGKCAAAVVGILFIHATFRVLEQTLPRRFGRADARYRVRKFVVFCGYLAILLFVVILFEDRLGRLSFALGAATTGCQNQRLGDKLGRSEIFRTRRACVTQLERASAF
jgi:hypothetical protein